MAIACRGLKAKVKVMGQVNDVGPTSIEGILLVIILHLLCSAYPLLVSVFMIIMFTCFMHFMCTLTVIC